jgi:4a-hydroxytetrahydrobiopterin dehydratase
MHTLTTEDLLHKKCASCEGGIPSIPAEQATAMLASVPGWELTPDGQRLARSWVAKNFIAAIDFFNKIAELAEKEGHHPDLHLEGYRNVTVEVWTHAISGLSENDFILAAKISALPISLRRAGKAEGR